ncbi:MAG: efflux RND transporter periplasmic adaptor subunit [Desulfovibrionaceae bacterium]|nr:efflux RND transporter periplasmic adaptor subunit [Desulfovibrionaceae bacterium]
MLFSLRLVFFLTACLILAACEQNAASPEKNVRTVSVKHIHPESISLEIELSGRVSAFRKAEVRPQVGGILKKQLFSEGSLVSANQSLYKIDADMYEASVRSAEAALSRARATLTQAELRLRRRRSLAGSHAVSRQDLEDAEASYLQAKADVDVAQAELSTARIRLRYTDVLAPITGRIGKSHMTQGSLVTANQDEPLAVIQQVDPVYVDMTRSSLELIKLRDRYRSGRLTRLPRNETPVTLMIDEAHVYPLQGKLQFSDISVDESTGMVLLRAVFPNPDGTLLPGLYVRALVSEGVEESVFLVPQIAVQRSARGEASVFLVDAESRVRRRTVVTAERSGRNIVIARGLAEGDRVIVSGWRGLRDGDTVSVADGK